MPGDHRETAGRGLRIGLDVRPALTPKTGDRTYILNLVRALARVDTENEYVLFADQTPAPGLLPTTPRMSTSVLRVWRPWMFTPFALPAAAARLRLDLLHVQYLIPPVSPCPVVTTIHDATFALYPKFFPPRHRFLLRTLIPFAVQNAALVLTGSHATHRDLCAVYARLPTPLRPIRVTLYGADPGFAPACPEDVARVRDKYRLDRPFVLSVGVLQPRKNFSGLMEAFQVVRGALPGLDCELCLVGKPGWGVELKPLPGVRLLGYVDDADLPALYSACEVFAFPSFYEGFGLPPLEAMACGAPVVCSQTGALPEVVGEAALTFDPRDVQAIARSLATVLEHASLRRTLRERSLAQARNFSWDRTAALTVAAYQEAARGNAPSS